MPMAFILPYILLQAHYGLGIMKFLIFLAIGIIWLLEFITAIFILCRAGRDYGTSAGIVTSILQLSLWFISPIYALSQSDSSVTSSGFSHEVYFPSRLEL